MRTNRSFTLAIPALLSAACAAWAWTLPEVLFAQVPVDVREHNGLNARPGDFNLDGVVNALDIGPLVSNFNGTDRSWQQGDANGDLRVNGLDVGRLLRSFSAPDLHAAPPNSMRGGYDPATGEIKISANQVRNWTLQYSDGRAEFNVEHLTLPQIDGGLYTSARDVVGVGSFSAKQTFTNHSLGRIAQPINVGGYDLFISYEADFGSPTIRVGVETCYPAEPSALMLVSLVSLAFCGRRRRA